MYTTVHVTARYICTYQVVGHVMVGTQNILIHVLHVYELYMWYTSCYLYM